MRILQPNLRFVVWTGKGLKSDDPNEDTDITAKNPRFLFFGDEDFRNDDFLTSDNKVKWVYGYNEPLEEKLKDISVFVPIQPISGNASLGFDGTGSATLNYNIGSEMVNKRFMFRPKGSKNLLFPLSDVRPNGGNNYDYFNYIVDRFIKPYKDYYQKTDLFTDNYLDYPGLTKEPAFIFQPCQVIWIFGKNKDNKWYKIFTGIINNITETDAPGKSRTLTITAQPPMQMFTKIPFFYMAMHQAFIESSLPDDTILHDFYKVYLAASFTGLENIGFDTRSDLTLSMLFSKMCQALNRRLGAITRDELNASVTDYESVQEQESKNITPTTKKVIPYGIGAGAGMDEGIGAGIGSNVDGSSSSSVSSSAWGMSTITDTEKDSFMKTIETEGMFKFKLFSLPTTITETKTTSEVINGVVTKNETEQQVESGQKYLGKSLEVSDKIGIENLFEDITKYNGGTQINSLGIFKISQDFYTNEGKLPSIFDYVLKSTLKYYDPLNKPISDTIRQIQSTLMVNIFNDGAGNLILEYPQFNWFPTLKNLETKQSEENISKYEDHNEEYIINKVQTSTFSFSTNTDGYVTKLMFPINYKLGGAITDPIETDAPTMKGRSWATAAETLRFGLKEVQLQQLFFEFGDFFSQFPDVLQKIADAFRLRYNSSVFSGTALQLGKCNWQLGRNVYIPHKEKIYLISRLDYSFDMGRSITNRATLVSGHTLAQIFPNPWKYIIDNEEILNAATTESITGETPSTVVKNTADSNAANYSKDDVKRLTGIELTDEEYKCYKIVVEESQKTLSKGINVRLAAKAAKGLDLFRNWAKTQHFEIGKKEQIGFYNCKPLITCVTGDNNRHRYSEAIDVAAIQWEDEKGNTQNNIQFNASEIYKFRPEKIFADKFVECMKNSGFNYYPGQQMEATYSSQDHVIWNTPVKNNPKYAGNEHFTHVHMSVHHSGGGASWS
jgi:hypothetical protein